LDGVSKIFEQNSHFCIGIALAIALAAKFLTISDKTLLLDDPLLSIGALVLEAGPGLLLTINWGGSSDEGDPIAFPGCAKDT